MFTRPARAGRIRHTAGFLRRPGEGLLTEHVDSGVERRQSDRLVQFIRRHDDDGVDASCVEHRLVAVVDRGDAVAGRDLGRTVGVAAGDGGHPRVRVCRDPRDVRLGVRASFPRRRRGADGATWNLLVAIRCSERIRSDCFKAS